MYFTLMGKLNARRKNLAKQDDQGFTLIELLVVVIIIGILAAIAIPVYLGVQNNAKDSAAKSDLANAKTAVVAYQTQNGKLPDGSTTSQKFSSASTELGQYGATVSTGTTGLGYKAGTTITASTTTFCIQETSAAGNTFNITESSAVASGACS